jgi:acetyltransferase-like isoleucine patch superfamily enzyme
VQYDDVLDLAIDLLCSMQVGAALKLCEEVAPQLDDGDAWFPFLTEFGKVLAGRGDVAAVQRAERPLTLRANSVLGEATQEAPRLRRLRQAAASTMRRVEGRARVSQPTVLHGPGRLVLGEGCQLGFPRSPGFASGVGYIDCRRPEAVISIGARTVLNNDFVITSESPEGISIGADCLVGTGVRVLDTDGHGLAADQRHGGHAATAPVVIEDNVWLGDGVVVLKGVTIGRDAVVAARAVVNRSVPAGSIVAGMPAKPVGRIPARVE